MRTFFYLLLLFSIGLAPARALGQGQIPDGDFENWTAFGGGSYEHPSSGWWASLNPLSGLGSPVTVEKSSDAHTGNYSAKFTTKQFGSILVPGLLLSGAFDILNPPGYFTRGQPYTARPTSFSGWFKYSPVNGDSGAIGMQLTRWNSVTGKRDTIGETGIIIPQATSAWTQFALPILYYSGDTPDTLVVALASSANGANFQGQVGSTLWADDLDLDVAASTSDPKANVLDLKFAETRDSWQLDAGKERGELEILDLSGKIHRSYIVRPGNNVFEKASLPNGLYLLRFRSDKGGLWFRKAALFH